jgi:hypothetical protein
MKFIKESLYWHGTGRIFDSLKRLLHEVMGCAATIVLTIFLCKVSIFPLLEELSLINYSIFYNRTKLY